MDTMKNENNYTKWVDVDYIQKNILPLSKRKIREIVKENLDVLEVGNKLLIEKSQLISFLRKEF